MALVTLKTRKEFLRVRGGGRWQGTAFVLETKPRAPDDPTPYAGPRFGFTVTKALGSAVTRNRIKRRLKAAIVDLAPACASPGNDYVVIGRTAALEKPYAEIKKDLEQAFRRVHHPTDRRRTR